MTVLFLAATLTTRLNEILDDRRTAGAVVSAIVTDLDGHVLFERNSSTRVLPASNMKLFSNSFALYELGPDARQETRIWKDADRTFVESTGDPLLSHDQLVEARNRLNLDRRLPVYVHEDYAPLWPENWEIGDLPNTYAAPVSAFTVDRAAFEIWSNGRRPQFRPESYGSRVVMSGSDFQYDPFRRTVFAPRTAFVKNGLIDSLPLPHPDEAAASLLGSRMVPTDSVPSRMPDLIIAGPKTIDIVGQCLPPSDNQLAEQLLLLGARREGPLGKAPYAVAQNRISNFLTRIVGIDLGDVKVDDGSGLSRHNYVTVRAIAKLLAWSDRQPTSAAWHAALPHSGSGTLASRLKGIAFEGKTGSMDAVSSLSGYLHLPSGKVLIVSVILNEFNCSMADTRAIQDNVVKAVAALTQE